MTIPEPRNKNICDKPRATCFTKRVFQDYTTDCLTSGKLYGVCMHSSFILIVMMTGVIRRLQLCPGITFTKKRLPAECVKVSPCGPRSIFIPRAQGSNFARVLAGWKEYLPACDGRAWGNVSLALEYAHSLDGERMAHYLFGSTRLTFTGSQVANRGPRDLLADEFGLPTTFKGAIHFEPRIDNVILDINYHLGLDEWLYGLYFKCNAPIVNTRWDLGVHCNEMNNVPNDELPQFPPVIWAKMRYLQQLASGKRFRAFLCLGIWNSH